MLQHQALLAGSKLPKRYFHHNVYERTKVGAQNS